MKKKLLVSALLFAMGASVLTGCGGGEKQEEPEEIVYLEESQTAFRREYVPVAETLF